MVLGVIVETASSSLREEDPTTKTGAGSSAGPERVARFSSNLVLELETVVLPVLLERSSSSTRSSVFGFSSILESTIRMSGMLVVTEMSYRPFSSSSFVEGTDDDGDEEEAGGNVDGIGDDWATSWPTDK